MAERQDPNIPIITHFGHLAIGEHTADCGVTDDNRRALLSARFGPFIGYRGKAAVVHGGLNFPAFMRRKGVSELLDGVLSDPQNQPFWVDVPQAAGRVNRAVAYPATILPDVCWAFVKAHFGKRLHPTQEHVAQRCLEIVEALGSVAIVALIDEVTGFQRERRVDELQNLLLERLVRPDRQEWVLRYTNEFFVEVYRIYEIHADPLSHHRPGYVGGLINFLIYDRIEAGLTAELQRLNEDRSAKHHQYLSDEGLGEWEDVMRIVMRIMKRSRTRHEFEDRLAVALPRSTEQLRLRLWSVDPAEFSVANASGPDGASSTSR